MSEAVHPVPARFRAKVGPEELAEMHRRANNDTDAFWLDQAGRLDWSRFPTQAGDWSFDEAELAGAFNGRTRAIIINKCDMPDVDLFVRSSGENRTCWWRCSGLSHP